MPYQTNLTCPTTGIVIRVFQWWLAQQATVKREFGAGGWVYLVTTKT
jgi:hypothetical protein